MFAFAFGIAVAVAVGAEAKAEAETTLMIALESVVVVPRVRVMEWAAVVVLEDSVDSWRWFEDVAYQLALGGV